MFLTFLRLWPLPPGNACRAQRNAQKDIIWLIVDMSKSSFAYVDQVLELWAMHPPPAASKMTPSTSKKEGIQKSRPDPNLKKIQLATASNSRPFLTNVHCKLWRKRRRMLGKSIFARV